MKINEYYLDGDSSSDFYKWVDIFENNAAFKGIQKEVPYVLEDVDYSLLMVYKFKGKIIYLHYDLFYPELPACYIKTLLDLETIVNEKLDKHIIEIEDTEKNIKYWNGKK